jgi:CubicO group peptidase (beta-lactamase class C family)
MKTLFPALAPLALGLGLALPAVSACGSDSEPRAASDTGSGGAVAAAGSSSESGGSADENRAGASGSSGDELQAAVASHETEVPFTLLLGDEDGTFFEGSKGASSPSTSYESASTSKWVAAVVILSLVEEGHLSLESTPADFIDGWTSDAADPRSQISLRQLLSFTSGLQPTGAFSDEGCVSNPAGTLESCVMAIHDAAASQTFVPGTEFIYGSHHLQVAGQMAVEARGAAQWSDVFDEFKDRTGLFPSSAFDLPSKANPRLAGGMHWTAEEYLAFLRALFTGELLSDDSRQALFTDHTAVGSVAIVESPALALDEMWHYALGNWRECPYPAWQDSCDVVGRVSSAGAYGAYPFIDFSSGFYGILARQGALGTFRDGLQVYRDLDPLIQELAAAK